MSRGGTSAKRGKTIQVFLIDGEPKGRIKCTLANWTGVAYKIPRTRVEQSKDQILNGLDDKQQEFLNFVLSKYEEKGVEELEEEKLPVLLNLKYNAIANAEQLLGSVDGIRKIFFAFQRNLYAKTN